MIRGKGAQKDGKVMWCNTMIENFVVTELYPFREAIFLSQVKMSHYMHSSQQIHLKH